MGTPETQHVSNTSPTGLSFVHQPRASAPLPPLESMRAYRACLHCRSRKTKCTLDVNGGRPPCRRCQREDRECVLGESHRGGRRVKKKTLSEESSSDQAQNPPPVQGRDYISDPCVYSQSQSAHSTANNQFSSPYDRRFSWQPSAALSGSSTGLGYQENSNQKDHPRANYPRASSPAADPKLVARGPVRESIASADLQNPSDALDILARVADRAEGGESPSSGQSRTPQPNVGGSLKWRAPYSTPKPNDIISYKPVDDGFIRPDMVYHFFSIYEKYYHPFFPIVRRETFDQQRIPWLSKAEPHLFSAIMTIASKDDERIHQICYEHMQHLVSMILAGADADIEAVEALLLLAQWVSSRPQAEIAIGRGEEDRVAWMYIGTALRLAYFLGIDRAAFRSEISEDPSRFNRKRLTWSACYVCDRSVSVRLGKGFWARGPGPLSGLRSSDFPSLQPLSPDEDDWALIYQANLELTQIFSNVHDILYSSKGHGWKQMLEGRYAKYLDDFRTSIRNWHETWSNLQCSPRLKGSLLLTYEYLRLYSNAFAYQATISRALIFTGEGQARSMSFIPFIDAAAPDARFIYEAIDAAKTLLTTFNSFVEPETLRYMPSSYYLYIIYSAVFLYKARSTTTMSPEERSDIRSQIKQTIDGLQRASFGANKMGARYARLVELLWRKMPRSNASNENYDTSDQAQSRDLLQQSLDPSSETASTRFQVPQPQSGGAGGTDEDMSANVLDPFTGLPLGMGNGGINGGPAAAGGGMFSWLDLGATWTFATQNVSAGETGDEVLGGPGGAGPGGAAGHDNTGGYDVAMTQMMDYRLLSDDNPNLLF